MFRYEFFFSLFLVHLFSADFSSKIDAIDVFVDMTEIWSKNDWNRVAVRAGLQNIYSNLNGLIVIVKITEVRFEHGLSFIRLNRQMCVSVI